MPAATHTNAARPTNSARQPPPPEQRAQTCATASLPAPFRRQPEHGPVETTHATSVERSQQVAHRPLTGQLRLRIHLEPWHQYERAFVRARMWQRERWVVTSDLAVRD